MAPSGLTLHAGPLTVSLDRGELRWIRFGEREVLRGIYGSVRGPGWVTVPPKLNRLRVDASDQAFTVTFDALHEHGPLRFAWTGRIEGHSEGILRYVLDGQALSTFDKNRIGLCVLHPSEGCAGRPCVVEHGDGRTTQAAFPMDIEPRQPFRDIRGIRHEVAPERSLEVRLDGEWFEMEDQRNWSDTSFKTYPTPADLPIPARVEAGTRVRHEVVVRLVSGGVAGALLEAPPPFVRQAPLRLGLMLGSGRPSARELDQLRALGLDLLRIDLSLDDPGFEERTAFAAEAARACGVSLHLAVTVPDGGDDRLGALAETCARHPAPVSAVFVYGKPRGLSEPGLISAARSALHGVLREARFGGGASGWFADLNRNRGAIAGADAVSVTLCPQVHARDEATIRENLGSLGDMARAVRSFAGEARLHLTPVTLAPRNEPPDPRLAEAFGGEWVRGLLRAASEAGFDSLTLGPAFGPGGVLGSSGDTPAASALREFLSTRT